MWDIRDSEEEEQVPVFPRVPIRHDPAPRGAGAPLRPSTAGVSILYANTAISLFGSDAHSLIGTLDVRGQIGYVGRRGGAPAPRGAAGSCCPLGQTSDITQGY